MGSRSGPSRGRVLDAGALIALERGDRRARAFIDDPEHALFIPGPVLAQVWRDGARQPRLAAVVNSNRTTIEIFDEHVAKAAGVLLGRSATSDVVDASVVLTARGHEAVVITTDARDIRRLDPELPIGEV